MSGSWADAGSPPVQRGARARTQDAATHEPTKDSATRAAPRRLAQKDAERHDLAPRVDRPIGRDDVARVPQPIGAAHSAFGEMTDQFTRAEACGRNALMDQRAVPRHHPPSASVGLSGCSSASLRASAWRRCAGADRDSDMVSKPPADGRLAAGAHFEQEKLAAVPSGDRAKLAVTPLWVATACVPWERGAAAPSRERHTSRASAGRLSASSDGNGAILSPSVSVWRGCAIGGHTRRRAAPPTREAEGIVHLQHRGRRDRLATSTPRNPRSCASRCRGQAARGCLVFAPARSGPAATVPGERPIWSDDPANVSNTRYARAPATPSRPALRGTDSVQMCCMSPPGYHVRPRRHSVRCCDPQPRRTISRLMISSPASSCTAILRLDQEPARFHVTATTRLLTIPANDL